MHALMYIYIYIYIHACSRCQASPAPEGRAEAYGFSGAPREGHNWQAMLKGKGGQGMGTRVDQSVMIEGTRYEATNGDSFWVRR